MIIAVSYKDNEIFEHFGHAEMFAIYKTNDDNTEILSKEIVEVKETGHQAVADLMDSLNVDAVIVGNIGVHARAALAAYGIVAFAGFCGNSDDAASFSCTVSFPSFPTRAAAAAVAPAARAAAAITTTTTVTAAAAAAADATDNRVYKNSVSENSDTEFLSYSGFNFPAFAFGLKLYHVGKRSVFLIKLLGRALLGNKAVLQNNDLIRAGDGAHAVGNYKHRFVLYKAR